MRVLRRVTSLMLIYFKDVSNLKYIFVRSASGKIWLQHIVFQKNCVFLSHLQIKIDNKETSCKKIQHDSSTQSFVHSKWPHKNPLQEKTLRLLNYSCLCLLLLWGNFLCCVLIIVSSPFKRGRKTKALHACFNRLCFACSPCKMISDFIILNYISVHAMLSQTQCYLFFLKPLLTQSCPSNHVKHIHDNACDYAQN